MTRTPLCFAAMMLMCIDLLTATRVASAGFVTVYGAPRLPESGEFGYGASGGIHVNETGMVVSNEAKYFNDPFGGVIQIGVRAVRWSSDGAALELETLNNPQSLAFTYASAIASSGAVVGSAGALDGRGGAAHWDEAIGRITILATPAGYTGGVANAINEAGVIIGEAERYDAQLGPLGVRTVRWNAAGVPTALGHLGETSSGLAEARPAAINQSGVAVGFSQRIDNGVELGMRAVRWDANSTNAVELDHLGVNPDGATYSEAFDVNSSGVSVGVAEKYDANGRFLGLRAVRWDALGTSATELGLLGTHSNGVSITDVRSINDHGTSVGGAGKFDDAGNVLGERAVAWKSQGDAPIEFLPVVGNLTDTCFARGINEADVAIGWCLANDIANTDDYRAVYFRTIDGAAVDLNEMIDPASGWLLTEAQSISDSGWIAGVGWFYPGGVVGEGDYYSRHFLMHVPAAAVPEPGAVTLLALCATGAVLLIRVKGWRAFEPIKNLDHRRKSIV